ENPGATLVMHTLPLEKGPVIDEKVDEDGPSRKRRKLASPVEDIPRLISVVEIVKREYSKSASKLSRGSSPSGPALHQYNLLGCLSTKEENEQQDELLAALDRKNYVQRTGTPYMKIYLSTRIQEDLEKDGAT
ncbi:16634_t:CDS:2, partial [Acaulospora colombiana]